MATTVSGQFRRANPIHGMLAAIPFACFTGTLVTDITYANTADMQWANFSAWMLVAGLVFGVLAGIAGLIDFGRHKTFRLERPGWPHALGNLLVLVLAVFNALVHSRDAYTSVMPAGLVLSIITVIVLLVTEWLGGRMLYRRVGEVR